MNMEKSKRKVAIDLNIRSAKVNVKEPMEVLILWTRGKSVASKHFRNEIN